MDAYSNIERNIVKEIVRECYPKRIIPNENFVAYFIKLLLLDPNWGITGDFVTSRENVAKFVMFVISQLEDKNDPKLITLEMQFYFTCSLDNMNNVVRRNRANTLNRLARLKNKIIYSKKPTSDKEIDNLNKIFVYYITLTSGLGNPKENEVYQDALAAFKSVVDEEEVKAFMALFPNDRENRIDQLTKIVSGIRLFNKDCNMGGVGISDLPTLLEQAVHALKDKVKIILKEVMNKVNSLTMIVDRCYTLQRREEDEDFILVYTLPNEMEEEDIEHIKELLVFFRQCELFIRKVLEKLQNIEDLSNVIYEHFQYNLREIYHIVYMKIAIPVNMIFPFFEILSDNWTELQNQVIVLMRYRKILVNLTRFTKNVHCSSELLESMLESTKPLTDGEKLQETSKLRIKSVNPKVKIADMLKFSHVENFRFEYLGFCSWKLVKTKGGLIPGNPNMGVAVYKKKNFIFSSPPGCTEFSRDPDGLISEILQLGREKPHLINFLLIKDQLEQVMAVPKLSKIKDHVKKTQEKYVQTKYMFSSEINRNYHWNVWDLKRQALQLANLSKRKTVSTQTHKSHFINTVNTQTYEMRDKEAQTRQDNYTNVPKPSTFIFGLRGRKDNKQFILDLTRTVSNS